MSSTVIGSCSRNVPKLSIGDIHVEDTENVYAVIDDVEKLPESPCLCFS